ncbi:MAG: cyclic nucleotide-binding domain-containing protein [Melioribacteraceae bacterium]|nr:cyclic nucleotide-binding domain-containing protein [Melioribacteraceae bacterium]MCF8412936.1 cyclic nucleotide-binding domain-containing protein [Melioribacteraceae bacterium]
MTSYRGKYDIPWNFLVAITASYIALFIPLDLVFNFHGIQIFFYSNLIVTLIFFLDIGYNIIRYKNCAHIYFSDKISCLDEYFKSWFIVDLMAAIPYVFFFDAEWIQLLRLLKLIRVAQFMARWRRREVKYASYLALSFFGFWTAISAHWISCGWLTLHGIDTNLDHLTNYIDSFYWTATTLTTVGFGDIVPNSNFQKIYAIFVEFMGVGVYGYLIGNIASILSKSDPAKARYLENIDKLSALVRYRKIPTDLQKRLQDYYTYIFNKRLGYDESSFIHDLPDNLKVEVSLQLKKEAIEKIHLFQNTNDDFKREIALHLKPLVLTPGAYAFKENDEGHELYFVVSGKLHVVVTTEEKIVANLDEGDFFGEIALFENVKRTASVKALTYCDLYQLTKKAFDFVVSKHPLILKQIEDKIKIRKKNTLHETKED